MQVASFKSVFIAVVIGTSLLLAALLVHRQRPAVERAQPEAAHVRATGKCAMCHREETAAVVEMYERSRHAAVGVSCLDCHGPRPGQEPLDHNGFTIARELTSANCATCHPTQYEQYRRSRHAAPAWAAVSGPADFTAEQIAFAEEHHPGAVDRPANELAQLEGPAAIASGCEGCHAVGKPNPDGSIGSCTSCHTRHQASVALARQPEMCGRCHMGPDHAQLEIYSESLHGVLYQAQKHTMDLGVRAAALGVKHMPSPTCATCHMSGLEGEGVTHDVGERLSYWLFAPVSERRPGAARSQQAMQEICVKCHTRKHVARFYEQAEAVLAATNERVDRATELMNALRAEGLLTPAPFDEPIEFVYFDYWHYFGRTAKHGAFMGGADYVQWHGNYELVAKLVELEEMAAELRHRAGEQGGAQGDAEAGHEAP